MHLGEDVENYNIKAKKKHEYYRVIATTGNKTSDI
jgi:hypothetical protein